MRRIFFAVLFFILLAGIVVEAQQVIEGVKAGYSKGEEAAVVEALEDAKVTIARVKYGGGGDWYSDPSSLPNLLRAFQERTGIPTTSRERVIELSDPNLRSYPFLYMTGHGNIKLSPVERERLRNYLLSGGFLYADDNYGMDRSFRQMVKEVFPDRELVVSPQNAASIRWFARNYRTIL